MGIDDDIFTKINKEYNECVFDKQDRIMGVLSKNMKKAIDRKNDAIRKYSRIQDDLIEEEKHFKNIPALLEEIKEEGSLLQIADIPYSDEDFEDIEENESNFIKEEEAGNILHPHSTQRFKNK